MTTLCRRSMRQACALMMLLLVSVAPRAARGEDGEKPLILKLKGKDVDVSAVTRVRDGARKLQKIDGLTVLNINEVLAPVTEADGAALDKAAREILAWEGKGDAPSADRLKNLQSFCDEARQSLTAAIKSLNDRADKLGGNAGSAIAAKRLRDKAFELDGISAKVAGVRTAAAAKLK